MQCCGRNIQPSPCWRTCCDSQSRAPFENPNGIPSQRPGLRRRRADSPPRSALAKQGAALWRAAKAEGTSYLGSSAKKPPQPQRGCDPCRAVRESQRDSIQQPRVAATRLPWVIVRQRSSTPTGLWRTSHPATTALGLTICSSATQVRLARKAWDDGHNPFEIG